MGKLRTWEDGSKAFCLDANAKLQYKHPRFCYCTILSLTSIQNHVHTDQFASHVISHLYRGLLAIMHGKL